MPSFRSPKLDDRTYDDLRRELVRRIPVHSPEWTDHNPGDPGIALLEVFAWLSENLLYRLNRVPDKAQLEFLNLLDVPPKPARPSRAMVRIDLPKGATDPVLIPWGPTADRAVVAAGKIEMQVEDELDVLPIEALPAIKKPHVNDPARPIVGLEEVQQAIQANLDLAKVPSNLAKYVTSLLAPPKNGVLADATPIGLAVDKTLWVALLVPQALAPNVEQALLAASALREKIAGRVLSLGVRLDSELCGPDDFEQCSDPGTIAGPLPVVWQVATGKFTGNEARIDKLRYDRLAVEGDTTVGLTTSGVWRLRLPHDAASFGAWTAADFKDASLLGAGDLPPVLDDDKLAARVITWIRGFRPRPVPSMPVAVAPTAPAAVSPDPIFPCSGAIAAPGDLLVAEELPQPVVRWVDINLVAVEQAVTAASEILGNGTGRPAQALRVTHTPVIDQSLYLEIREPSGWVQWQPMDSFGASGPGDPHYVIDPSAGEIRFGDGIHGRMPRVGEAIRARSYRYGGGVRGNVPAGAISKIKSPPAASRLQVTNLLAAEGGVDGETIEQAKARVPLTLRNHDRAVAAEDFRDIALETPGAGLGRVEVLPRHKPAERVDEVPGVITLIVIPAYDPLHPEEPVPDRETLRRVCVYLEPRRLVTTELYVTPPEYVEVWISVAFAVEPSYGVQTVGRWVELAIRQYLAPLPPYGPGGQGWPFGRDVSARDVEAAVLRVEGVELVYGVTVEGPLGVSQPKANAVHLQRWQLPVVRGLQLTNADPPDAIDRNGDSARADGDVPLPVPVIPEVC